MFASTRALFLSLALVCPALPGLAAAAAAPGRPIDLGSGNTLVPLARFTDDLGETHLRLEHRYRGLRVWGSELIMHRKGGKLLACTPSPALAMRDARTPLPQALPLDLEPTVDLDQARATVAADLGVPAENVFFAGVERVAYPLWVDHAGALSPGPLNAARFHRHLAGFALAYLLEPRVKPALLGSRDYLVDAHSGRILERLERDRRLQPARGKAYSFVQGGQVDLDQAQDGDDYVLVDPTRGRGGPYGGNYVTDLDYRNVDRYAGTGDLPRSAVSSWGDGQMERDGRHVQTTEADAAHSLQTTWDFYRRVLKRDGLDGQGTAVSVRIHARNDDTDADNAWFSADCGCVNVAQGRMFAPLTDLETLAHELTHGVTWSTAGLEPDGEPAALDEATSDFFSVMVTTWARHGSGATIGDQGAQWTMPFLQVGRDGSVRRLVDRYLDQPSRDGRSPDAWSPELAGMDPHLACGPLNRALYFLANGAVPGPPGDPPGHFAPALPDGMAGIGDDKAAHIWYRALTTYLTPSSDYLAARAAALRAAQDLYGPKEAAAVRQAFAAIRVGDADAGRDELATPTLTASVHASALGLELQVQAAPGAAGAPAAARAWNEVDYYVDNVLVAAVFGEPFSVVLEPSRTLANGSHQLTACAYSAAGAEGTTPAVPFTLANRTQQLLVDPSLEADTGAWRGDLDAVLRTDYTGMAPRSFYRCAQFDRSSGGKPAELAQRVTIPAGARQVTLSLWTRISGEAAATADRLTVEVRQIGADGGVAAAEPLAAYTATDAAPDWLKRSFDLGRFAGQEVELALRGEVAAGSGTVFQVDDLALLCSEGE